MSRSNHRCRRYDGEKLHNERLAARKAAAVKEIDEVVVDHQLARQVRAEREMLEAARLGDEARVRQCAARLVTAGKLL